MKKSSKKKYTYKLFYPDGDVETSDTVFDSEEDAEEAALYDEIYLNYYFFHYFWPTNRFFPYQSSLLHRKLFW